MKKKPIIGVLLIISVILIVVLFHNKRSMPKKQEVKKLSPVLNIYNWEDYFGTETIENFEKKFKIKVNLDTFEDEGEMVSALQAYPDKYDIIVTSEDTIRELIQMRLLARIDLNNVTNLCNIGGKFQKPVNDPDRSYSVPYLWGTTGFVVNRDFVKEKDIDLSVLLNSEYKGKIAMLNNYDEVIGAFCKYLGYSINTNDISELESVREIALKQKPLLVGYLDPIDIRSKLISGELWAAHVYSGEAMFAVDKNDSLEYVIPKQGSVIWVDNFAIPRDAKHKYTAEVFINYVLDPEVSADIANYLWYANCNNAARSFTLKEVLESSSLYPPEDVLERCEFFKSVGVREDRRKSYEKRNAIWSELNL